MNHSRILIVDDEPDIRGMLGDVLGDEGFETTAVGDIVSARQAIGLGAFDLILLDIWMPGASGMDWLAELADPGPLPCPVVMMSGHGTIETALEAVRLGAYDFIEKPLTLDRLLQVVTRALEASRLRRDVARLRREQFPELALLGHSDAVTRLREVIGQIATLDEPVLIQGEPGVGKEEVARALHAASRRSAGPFVSVAAGALADEGVAASLFGEERAEGPAIGLIEQASGGTVYVDEVADLGLDAQLRLSSVMERRELLRIGGRQPVPLDLRFIVASSQDLAGERAAGRLRDELFYQLGGLVVPVPALRQRLADIGVLLDRLIERNASRDGRASRRPDGAALAELARHPWPGNLRELRNITQRLLLFGTGPVGVDEVQRVTGTGGSPDELPGEVALARYVALPLREAREAFERDYLSRRLEEAGGSVAQLARQIGLERTHLYRKLRDLQIDLPGQRDS